MAQGGSVAAAVQAHDAGAAVRVRADEQIDIGGGGEWIPAALRLMCMRKLLPHAPLLNRPHY